MLYNAIDVAASGLTAQRLRMDIISNNIANAETTSTVEGGPYRRQEPVFASRRDFAAFYQPLLGGSEDIAVGKGVRVQAVHEDEGPFRRKHKPEHPDADDDGYVEMPNVDTVTEMVDMISASRAYEANVTVIDAAKDITRHALNIGR